MTKIHTGPPVVAPLERTEDVRAPVATPAVQTPVVTPDLPPSSSSSTPVARAADPTSAPVTLGEIAALRSHESFGSGARVRPLAIGAQSLDDPSRPENAELLDLDLHEMLLADAQGDPEKLAAVQALADAYGTEALGPIKKDPS